MKKKKNTLRHVYSVIFRDGKWTVGVGKGNWGTLTIHEATREAKLRNKNNLRPK